MFTSEVILPVHLPTLPPMTLQIHDHVYAQVKSSDLHDLGAFF